jgi:regulatory protein
MAELSASKPVGLYAFKRKLRAKGICDDDAEEALSAFDDDQQRAAALLAAQKLYRKYEALPEREARAKLSQALARRGFSWDAIESAVEQVTG